jgi:hypothetical protein
MASHDSVRLSKADILRLFEMLEAELAAVGTDGEVYLVGGAVMCLALDARDSTRDVDAAFHPAEVVRKAAARVADAAGVPEGWLNDSVKGWLSDRGEFGPYLELPHLKVFVARPEYLLAMKCIAWRIGAGFSDENDVRYLLRYLNITTAKAALEIVLKYFDASRIPAKTSLALEELLGA